MSNIIKMPQLSPTMTAGVIANWLVDIGDEVKQGDLIVEVETDKVTVEVEANESGVISELGASVGEELAVGSTLVSLLPTGSTVDKAAESKVEVADTPQKSEVLDDLLEDLAEHIESPIEEVAIAELSHHIKISPVAKRMALQNNIDVTNVKGTGANGKIVKKDIDDHLNISWEEIATAKPVVQSTIAEIDYDSLPSFTRQPNTSMRNVVASRLTESSRDIPHFYMSVDCRIDALLDLRKQLNERTSKEDRISVNDMLIKAVAKAFQKVPEANVMWAGDSILSFNQSDISIAVAIDNGLITPVVVHADKLSISELAKTSKDLVNRARDGKLAPNEYKGGTFTISNLGMFGIDSFTSIINPPQCGILSVGSGEKRAIVVKGEIAVATMLNLTLAMDHRCVDGAVAAKFIQVLKHQIEDPFTLVL